MKILELENALNNEKNEHQKDLETNEKLNGALLKRNDQLWSQMTIFENKYKEALVIIKEKNEKIEQSQNHVEKLLKDKDIHESELKEINREKVELVGKLDKLNVELNLSKEQIQALEEKLFEFNKERSHEIETSQLEKNSIRDEISKLEDEIARLRESNQALNEQIASLNKEKSIILNQSEQQQKFVLADYLKLQESITSLNYQLNTLTSENEALKNELKETKQLMNKYEKDLSENKLRLTSEIRKNTDAVEKIKSLELIIKSVRFLIFESIFKRC